MAGNIVFTDRYGGDAPSWLRGCFGPCEATGWVPIRHDETDPVLRALWEEAEARAPTDNGWHFVRCPDCRGLGRVSWWRTVLRVPRWALKGVRFVWQMGIVRNKEFRPAHMTWGQQFWLAVRCAVLADLGLWKP